MRARACRSFVQRHSVCSVTAFIVKLALNVDMWLQGNYV